MSDNSVKARGKTAVIIIGAALGVAVTLTLLFLFAAAVYVFNLDRAYTAPLSTLSLAAGSFAAAWFVAIKTGHKGYLIGALVGISSFAAVTVISLIFNKNGLTLNTLFHFVIILLASVIGGIAGVNKGKNKKYI